MAQSNQTYFTELNKYCQNKEYDKALKSANKILSLGVDEKALRCKVVCHIFRLEYDKALQTIIKNPQVLQMTFEKAYCLYRLNRTKEANDILQNIPNPTLREKELLAQIMYRLEKYEECQNLYLEVIKNTSDEYEEERKTNLAAAYAHLYLEQPAKATALPPLEDSTYELAYNKATILLAQEKHKEAYEQLGHAEEIYKSALEEEEEEVAEEDMEGDLSILRIQRAYTLQKLGKVEEAMNLYNQVLRLKPTDVTLTAVAANNVITLNKDQNMFDSKKKIRLALADGLEVKLTTRQRFGIAYNHCLVLLLTNNLEGCKSALAQAECRFHHLPQAPPLLCLLKAALKTRLEKQPLQAIQLLQEHLKDSKERSLSVQLTLAQLLLGQGQVLRACELLRKLGPRYPAVAAALVVLYQSQSQLDQALAVLEETIAYHHNQPALLRTLIRCCAELYLRNQQPQKAAQLWEQLRTLEPDNPQVLAHLISAYSQYDPDKARLVSQQLPDIDCSSVDVEQLESGSWAAGGSKFLRRAAKATDSPGAATANGPLKKKSKKKHKKGKLPKNFDPNVDPDPERWLPKHQRSTYKKRKDRRAGGGGVGKGTQGSTNVAEMEAPKAPVAAKPLPSPGQSAPRHKVPVNKKKKKRTGGKW